MGLKVSAEFFTDEYLRFPKMHDTINKALQLFLEPCVNRVLWKMSNLNFPRWAGLSP